ncbi:MAG TPA: hypothetical protein VKG25_11100 [Bryobacteraceae bacterium]|nr:hypothetical protein [Bryobacteraceae bacterium]
MKPLWADKAMSALGCAALLAALVVGDPGKCAAQTAKPPVAPCTTTDPPCMTIIIYNNTKPADGFNIYPVLTTGINNPDKWLQLQFHNTSNSYGRDTGFRFYINPTGDGIPPGGHVTITLPLYTKLAAKGELNQNIDWWNGGRIEIFDSPGSTHQPPPALTKLYTGETDKDQAPVPNIASDAVRPSCVEGCASPLEFFMSKAGIKNNEPEQLTEYTIGSDNITELNVHQVDYDVSYVDTAYLPVVMEPYNNKQVGYIGSPNSVTPFRQSLTNFLQTSKWKGWPQFKDNQGVIIPKVPSALHIFAGDPDMSPSQGDPAKTNTWPNYGPIQDLANRWTACVSNTSKDATCAYIVTVSKLIQANYDNYVKNYRSLGCNYTKFPDPVAPLTLQLTLQHAYGWTPFTEGLCNAALNLLENTPPDYNANHYALYQKVKEQFDKLQYWPIGSEGTKEKPYTGEFDPYLVLIHNFDYLGAKNAYAYSVDDAVGNMNVKGDGLILAVGGTENLPNQNPAVPPINVQIGGPTGKLEFTKYGICTDVPDTDVVPSFRSFYVSATDFKDCTLSLAESPAGTIYRFSITKPPPYAAQILPPASPYTPDSTSMIDCSANADKRTKDWCARSERPGGPTVGGIFGYSNLGPRGHQDNYIVTPSPTALP